MIRFDDDGEESDTSPVFCTTYICVDVCFGAEQCKAITSAMEVICR